MFQILERLSFINLLGTFYLPTQTPSSETDLALMRSILENNDIKLRFPTSLFFLAHPMFCLNNAKNDKQENVITEPPASTFIF